jgi:hypothetical protein
MLMYVHDRRIYEMTYANKYGVYIGTDAAASSFMFAIKIIHSITREEIFFYCRSNAQSFRLTAFNLETRESHIFSPTKPIVNNIRFLCIVRTFTYSIHMDFSFTCNLMLKNSVVIRFCLVEN